MKGEANPVTDIGGAEFQTFVRRTHATIESSVSDAGIYY